MPETIPGYAYGDPDLPQAPFDTDDLANLEAATMWTDEDEKALRMAGDVLEDQVEEVVETWYGFVADNDHLIRYFSSDHQPDEQYLERVRARFEQWILDTCRRPYDQTWLDYQHEIGLRHHRTKKNRTDDVDAAPNIDLRYMIAFIYPITATIRDFLEDGDQTEAEVEKMYNAWFKAVTLQVALWARPYAKDGDW